MKGIITAQFRRVKNSSLFILPNRDVITIEMTATYTGDMAALDTFLQQCRDVQAKIDNYDDLAPTAIPAGEPELQAKEAGE